MSNKRAGGEIDIVIGRRGRSHGVAGSKVEIDVEYDRTVAFLWGVVRLIDGGLHVGLDSWRRRRRRRRRRRNITIV